jgi:hypothetical protein
LSSPRSASRRFAIALAASAVGGAVLTAAWSWSGVADRSKEFRDPSGQRVADSLRCGPREAALLIHDFLRAFNNGDRDRISTYVDSSFIAYSSRDGSGREPLRFQRAGRSTVIPFLVDRHRRGERMALLIVEVAERFRTGRAGVFFVVSRRADDLARLGLLDSARVKGEVECSRGTIRVWNMVTPTGPRSAERRRYAARPCPVPGNWRPARFILACRAGASGGTSSSILIRR